MVRVLVLALAFTALTAASAESAQRPSRALQHSLLQQSLRAFPGTTLTGRAGAPTKGWAVNRHPSFLRSTWLYFTLRPADAVEYVRQTWQADVCTGLVAGVSKSRGWRPVTGQTFTLVLPNGRERFDSGSVLGSAFRGGITHADEVEAERVIREGAARVGATVQALRFPRPLGRLAIEVVVTTDRPREFASPALGRVHEIWSALSGRVEGVYIEVRATDGRWVAAYGGAVRTSSGVSVVNTAFR